MEGLRRLLANPSQFRLDSSINDTFEWLIIKLWVDLLQNEVLQDFLIEKPSLYRMILRYVNPNDHTVMAKVKLSPENPNDAEQSYLVRLEPTREPAFVTVAGPSGNLPTPFILNPGSWTSSIATNNSLFLDYFALLPAAYYEATILQQKVLEKKKSFNGQFCTIKSLRLSITETSSLETPKEQAPVTTLSGGTGAPAVSAPRIAAGIILPPVRLC